MQHTDCSGNILDVLICPARSDSFLLKAGGRYHVPEVPAPELKIAQTKSSAENFEGLGNL
jgi:hypothetical protein